MRLRFVATINPRVQGFDHSAAGDEISFIPLECVWMDDRFDASQVIEYSGDVGSYNAVNEGDLLLPKVSPTFAHGRCAHAVGLVGGRALATSEVFVIRPHMPADARFIQYRLISPDFINAGVGAWTGVAGLKRVSADFVRDTWIDERVWTRRDEIVEFLEREFARIADAVSSASALSDRCLAIERRRVECLIDQDYDLGTRPRLRWVADVLSGFAFPSDGFVYDDDAAIRLLRGVNVGVGEIRWEQVARWPAEDADAFRKWALRAGDLVLGMDRPWISSGTRVAVMSESDLPALLLQRVACIRPTDSVLTSYLRLWLEHPRFEAELGSATTGVSVPHISGDQIRDFRIGVPSIERQVEVASEAETLRRARRDVQITGAKLVRRLDAYRSALVGELMRGRLDHLARSEQEMAERAHAEGEGAVAV